jgi:hypothetical protein
LGSPRRLTGSDTATAPHIRASMRMAHAASI